MILYFDTETTGLYPGNICQLSYIMQNKESVTAKNMYFAVENVDYGAYKVHGLSVPVLEELSGGKYFVQRIEEIEADFTSADALVAHNIAFDRMFMRSEFENAGRDYIVNKEFCSMKLMTPVVRLPRANGRGYKYPKLSEMCDYFSVSEADIYEHTKKIFNDTKGFHDARFDTVAVYLAVNAGLDYEEALAELKNYL